MQRFQNREQRCNRQGPVYFLWHFVPFSLMFHLLAVFPLEQDASHCCTEETDVLKLICILCFCYHVDVAPAIYSLLLKLAYIWLSGSQAVVSVVLQKELDSASFSLVAEEVMFEPLVSCLVHVVFIFDVYSLRYRSNETLERIFEKLYTFNKMICA